jgi:hypothetical protein
MRRRSCFISEQFDGHGLPIVPRVQHSSFTTAHNPPMGITPSLPVVFPPEGES